jgi:arabinogalactan endo-1,4-beta-galactosidase
MQFQIRLKTQFPYPNLARVCAVTVAAVIPLLMAGCASHKGATASAAARSPQFYLGADISALATIEQRGGVYLDGDQPGDAIAIFMKQGWTCFRLRVWVDPTNGVNGLEYTVKLAKRIKAAGGTFILDFHYSDWWADPQKQNKPAAWANLDFDALVQQSLTYTTQVVKALKDAGATPDFVQVGNEITGGLLWPEGQVKVPTSNVKVFEGDVQVMSPPEPYDDAKQWSRLIRLLKADINGVSAATIPADNVRIIIHLDCGGDWPVTKWYLDHLEKAGVDYDVVGQSYYPHWHGSLENVRDNIRKTRRRYDKDVMIVETGYPSRDTHPSAAAARYMIWPETPAGQKQFLADLIRTVKEAGGNGVNYWHPETTFIPGDTNRWRGPNADSLFDGKGHPLPAMNVMGLRPETTN